MVLQGPILRELLFLKYTIKLSEYQIVSQNCLRFAGDTSGFNRKPTPVLDIHQRVIRASKI